MTDYISRKAAIANSREYNLDGSYDNTERAVPVDAINSIPAADVVEVVHGKWIRTSHRFGYGYMCSECGCVYHRHKGKLNYCPNCGADMRGDNNGR